MKTVKIIQATVAALGIWLLSGCAHQESTAKAAEPVLTLDRKWILTQLGETKTSDQTAHQPYVLLFSADNRFGGNGGCNQINGQYELNGQTVRFSKILSTRKLCRSGMQQERAFVDALVQTRSWQKQGGQIWFLDEKGSRLLSFQ